MTSSSGKDPVYATQCIVCLKDVREGDGICHFPFENHWLTICCPLCMSAFEADPKSYLGRKLPSPQENRSMF